MTKIILQKFIADAGVCSRRKAEELIKKSQGAGKNAPVLVNGRPAEAGMRVVETDEVRVNGKKINLPSKKIYIKLNKPRGYTCTNRKFKEEKNVFELLDKSPLERGGLPKARRGVLNVAGRLDKDSRGLVILTNDGEFIQKTTHPKYEHEKEYLTQIATNQKQIATNSIIERFVKGVDIGDGDGVVRAKKVEYLGNNEFRIVLTEGKKRQIRRMFLSVGLKVIDLKRIRIGNIELGNLNEGKWEEIKAPKF